jgi:hypothetical protein
MEKVMSKKYEITFIQGAYGYINKTLEQWQEKGWEIGGDILITKRKIADDPYIYIPLKREIQAKPE